MMKRTSDISKLRLHAHVLQELAHFVTELRPTQQLLDGVVTQVARAVEIDHVKIMRYRPECGDLIVAAGTGWQEGVVGQATFAIDLQSPPGAAFQTGQSIHILNLLKDADYRRSTILAEHNIISVINVPVEIDGATWGVLEVDSTEERDFSTDTKTFLTTAASLVAVALRREQAAHQYEAALGAAAVTSDRVKTLLDESHHRMKNNFQLILSMLQMQRSEASAATSGVLSRLIDNVMAMSLANDQLAIARGTSAVNLPSYLRSLVTRVQKPFEKVSAEVHAEDMSVPIEYAVVIGLIVNELVTNCVKHAFGKSGGLIQVDLARGPGRGEVQLVVRDNGRGMVAQKSGTGLKLLDGLARHIRGHIEHTSAPTGTLTKLVFAASLLTPVQA